MFCFVFLILTKTTVHMYNNSFVKACSLFDTVSLVSNVAHEPLVSFFFFFIQTYKVFFGNIWSIFVGVLQGNTEITLTIEGDDSIDAEISDLISKIKDPSKESGVKVDDADPVAVQRIPGKADWSKPILVMIKLTWTNQTVCGKDPIPVSRLSVLGELPVTLLRLAVPWLNVLKMSWGGGVKNLARYLCVYSFF